VAEAPAYIPFEISKWRPPAPTEADREKVEYWTRELEREIREYKTWRMKRRLRFGAWIAIIVLMLVAKRSQFSGFWWMWWLFGGGAAADTAAGSRYRAVSELAGARDPRAAGVLAIACRDGDGDMRRLAARTLTNLMPRLQASDAAFFSDDAMNALIAQLHRRDTALLVAILKGLQQIGDERAIPDVTALRDNDMRDPRDWKWVGVPTWEDVRTVAAESLPYLEKNAERRRASSTLLRAAQSPAASDIALLRPAVDSQTEPPQQLLRPVSGSGSEEMGN